MTEKHDRFRVDGGTLQTDSGESLKVSVERDEKEKTTGKTNHRTRTQPPAGETAEPEDGNVFGVKAFENQ